MQNIKQTIQKKKSSNEIKKFKKQKKIYMHKIKY